MQGTLRLSLIVTIELATFFVTSVDLFCENGIETWTVDDNAGEISYGRSAD